MTRSEINQAGTCKHQRCFCKTRRQRTLDTQYGCPIIRKNLAYARAWIPSKGGKETPHHQKRTRKNIVSNGQIMNDYYSARNMCKQNGVYKNKNRYSKAYEKNRKKTSPQRQRYQTADG